jgi:hypothetical protein
MEIVGEAERAEQANGKCRGWSVQVWFRVEVLEILLAVAFDSREYMEKYLR